MKGDNFMKAMYKIPNSEVISVKAASQMMAISGPEGLTEGGQAEPTTKPKAPERPF